MLSRAALARFGYLTNRLCISRFDFAQPVELRNGPLAQDAKYWLAIFVYATLWMPYDHYGEAPDVCPIKCNRAARN